MLLMNWNRDLDLILRWEMLIFKFYNRFSREFLFLFGNKQQPHENAKHKCLIENQQPAGVLIFNHFRLKLIFLSNYSKAPINPELLQI